MSNWTSFRSAIASLRCSVTADTAASLPRSRGQKSGAKNLFLRDCLKILFRKLGNRVLQNLALIKMNKMNKMNKMKKRRDNEQDEQNEQDE